MRYSSWCASLFGVALLFVMSAGSAQAQATRTWVSGVGDDANPCSRTAPCKTFAGAISKTATGGEINCLDPGGFGAVTITKSITIICGEVGTAGVLGVGDEWHRRQRSAGAKVLLEGLDIEGLGHWPERRAWSLSASNVTIRKLLDPELLRKTESMPQRQVTRVVIADSTILSNNGGVNIGAAGVSAVGILLRTIVDNHPAFSVSVANTSKLIMSASKLLEVPPAFRLPRRDFHFVRRQCARGYGNADHDQTAY